MEILEEIFHLALLTRRTATASTSISTNRTPAAATAPAIAPVGTELELSWTSAVVSIVGCSELVVASLGSSEVVEGSVVAVTSC